ncbi:phage tail length tape measure family protein [Sinorhizobium meliloti]|uniref:phage tail length tape measure family protein n=1 Tax=Rhizobium meliloti TaxID=382 RepID=UPI0001E4D32D|nr:phage tail length tape measure family protein [Sinorhizobium meliloti]AEG52582.1 Prophage tail length tape measure [Sinorhizobium meliloti AK83]MDE4591702.1 phage tail length tape measure family protein [Sinorhizobium meliloti]SEJ03027.1 Prophage tail length tape measure protein [Sinorhizobium meliloti]
MSEATLGFKIDSSPAVKGAADLDHLTAAAGRTQQAVGKLENEVEQLGGALGKAGQGAGRLKPPIDDLGRSFGAQDEHVRAFRMEVERLTLKYQPLAKATRDYEASIGEIQRAHKLGAITAQEMTQALDRERQAYERLKTSATAAGAAVKAANTNRPGGQGFNSANAAFQFQDIAVTAAMGMNPLMIGLQQGTQLASVVGSMERPVAGLTAAFASLINPVSLVTIGLTAGTAALIQYFSTSSEGTSDMALDLERQKELIAEVAAQWGDALPALKAYADQQQRLEDAQRRMDAVNIAASNQWKILDSQVGAAGNELLTVNSILQDLGDIGSIVALQEAVKRLETGIANETATARDAISVQQLLTGVFERHGIPVADMAAQSYGNMADAIERAGAAATRLRGDIRSIQDIISESFFTENGKTMRTADFMPRNPGVPTSRPNIELSGDPDATTILNSDGRLTGVPVPGQKPNFFELETQKEKVDDATKAYRQAAEAKADFWLDISFQERQAERSAIDRQVATTLTRYGFNEDLNSPEADAIRQGLRREEAKDAFKGFFDGIHQEAWANGGKIGDAIVKSALSAAQKASEKAWSAIFDQLGTAAASWLTGGSKAGAGAVSAGFNATTTFGSFLGANDNKTFAAPVGAVTRGALPPTTEIASYIAKAAAARGIDPDIALRVAKSEGGLNSWNLQSNYVKNGVREPSFGPFQLYKGGGLGNKFMAQTGLDPADASAGPAGIDFALDEARKSGWGAWYGAKKAGIGNFEGIGTYSGGESAVDAVTKLGEASRETVKGLSALGQGAGGLGQTLASIPQALMANGGGSGILSSLTKYGMGLFSGSGQFASAMLSGGIGLFANGTNYAPGGLSVVGERGPELVNLPQGSGVMSNHKLMQSLNDNNNQRSNAPANLNVNVIGANGDDHVRALVRQGVGQALSQYNEQQRRVGFGETQKRFVAQKG